MQARRPIKNGSVFCRSFQKRKPEAARVNMTWVLAMMLNVKVHSADLQNRDGLALAFEWFVHRFPFIEKICADGRYQGPVARKNSPRPLEIIRRNQSAFEVLPKRWTVERTLAWPGINRRLAKNYERFAKTAESFIQIAMIKLMIR